MLCPTRLYLAYRHGCASSARHIVPDGEMSMPAKRILSAALALLLVAAIPARATSVPTLTVIDTINPGAGSSSAMDVSDSVALSGYLYFAANDGTHGYELWRTDGTTTELVQDIYIDDSSYPYAFTVLGDWLYFAANDGTHGTELWRTNGTTTELVQDINTGNSGADSSYPEYFTALGDWLYFRAYDGTHGYELWRTDGTTTERVPFPVADQEIDCDCYDTNIVAVGDRLYTTVYSDAIGHEFAYLPGALPPTNREGSVWTTALVILAGLTAAASIGLRVRGAKRA